MPAATRKKKFEPTPLYRARESFTTFENGEPDGVHIDRGELVPPGHWLVTGGNKDKFELTTDYVRFADEMATANPGEVRGE